MNLLINRNISLIYSVTIFEQKTKDCTRSGSLQHDLQHLCFQLWCLPAPVSSTNYSVTGDHMFQITMQPQLVSVAACTRFRSQRSYAKTRDCKQCIKIVLCLRSCMCTINSFVGYAIVKSKTSGICFCIDSRFYSMSVPTVLLINGNRCQSRVNSCYSCVGLSLLTHDPEGHPK